MYKNNIWLYFYTRQVFRDGHLFYVSIKFINPKWKIRGCLGYNVILDIHDPSMIKWRCLYSFFNLGCSVFLHFLLSCFSFIFQVQHLISIGAFTSYRNLDLWCLWCSFYSLFGSLWKHKWPSGIWKYFNNNINIIEVFGRKTMRKAQRYILT